MNTLRKCIALAAATAAASAANADININDNLSISGFLDMSYVYRDVETNDSGTASFGIDQAETTFHYSNDQKVSAQVSLEYEDNADSDTGFKVEEAFITKQVNDQLSLKAGRFLSYSGWETEEPTGLYQYSPVGAIAFMDMPSDYGYGALFYGGYQQGVSAHYDAGVVDVALNVVNDVFDSGETDNENLSYELMVGVNPAEGLNAKLFYIVNNAEGDADDDELINFWASYESDGFTAAFEYNTAEYTNGDEAEGYLLMGNYAFGDYGVTLRYHDLEKENSSGATLVEQDGITLAGSKACSDNLLLVAEYRMDTVGDGSSEADVDQFAIEALFTF